MKYARLAVAVATVTASLAIVGICGRMEPPQTEPVPPSAPNYSQID